MHAPPIEALPPNVRAALAQFAESLEAKLAGDLAAIVLYGGVAKGHFEEHASDLNLLVVLREASLAALDHVGTAAVVAQRAARVQLLILAEKDLPECVE